MVLKHLVKLMNIREITKLLSMFKRVGIVTIKFYFSIVAIMLPISLLFYWPNETPFNLFELARFLQSFILQPIIYVEFVIVYVGFLLFEIANK